MALEALRQRAPFRVGMKEVYLPNFTITLLRNERLPPTFASFLVPLNMNKLDMRDYLYHAYNVKSVAIRSFIKQAPVRQGKPHSLRPQIKRWFRPRASKKMTVEMDLPFIWPAPAKDLEAWNKTTFDQARQDNRKYQEERGRLSDTLANREDREKMREQAKALLEGRERWKTPLDRRG